ncbi:MAG: hypothetical protein AAF385_13950 [Pseudomonadota bacterium]
MLIYALAILSVAAGVPKILQQPQELGFLAALGFSNVAVSALGVVQVLGGLLLFAKKTRLVGAVLAALALGVSSAALFVSGTIKFGLISLLPVVVAVLIFWRLVRKDYRAE